MEESQVELVIKWYLELEARLTILLETIQYTEANKRIFLSPLANIIIDACSLVDAVFRKNYIGDKKADTLNINDFCSYYCATLKLHNLKTLLYQYPPVYIVPFNNWIDGSGNVKRLQWWQNYNLLKHDRLKEYESANLETAINCVCAIHQIMSQSEDFMNGLIRYDLVCFGQYNASYAKEAIFKEGKDVTALVETSLFATPVGRLAFPDKIDEISPFNYSVGKKLWRYIGREF